MEADFSVQSLARMENYSCSVIGPVMFKYTLWVLNEAERRGIKRLYFLARDGYLLLEIAKRICERLNLKIECKYLYCSRQALRLPSYSVIGEEAYRLLLLGGYRLTPKSVLSRAALTEEEILSLCSALGISNPDTPLNDGEFSILAEKLRSSEEYRRLVNEKSAEAYPFAIGYLRQEGLFDCDTVAVVDSGWTGSMQRSLRQLMQSAGYTGGFLGFYFGMYEEQKEACDGEYLTYYFSKRSGTLRKVNFNNNLFECMLSAPHPMTVGYALTDGKYCPVTPGEINENMLSLINAQISGAIRYTEMTLEQESSLSIEGDREECYRIFKRAMTRPTREEAQLYTVFRFSDDVTDEGGGSLVSENERALLKKYNFIPRIFKKVVLKKKATEKELFWVHGSIAVSSPALLRPWYRFNVWLWNLIKYLK